LKTNEYSKDTPQNLNIAPENLSCFFFQTTIAGPVLCVCEAIGTCKVFYWKGSASQGVLRGKLVVGPVSILPLL